MCFKADSPGICSWNLMAGLVCRSSVLVHNHLSCLNKSMNPLKIVGKRMKRKVRLPKINSRALKKRNKTHVCVCEIFNIFNNQQSRALLRFSHSNEVARDNSFASIKEIVYLISINSDYLKLLGLFTVNTDEARKADFANILFFWCLTKSFVLCLFRIHS